MDDLRTRDAEGGGGCAASLSRLWFAPEVHWVGIDHDAVLLDVPADAYHCLPGGADLCRRLAHGEPVRFDQTVRSLHGAGLLSATPTPAPRQPPPVPVHTIIHERSRKVRLSDVAAAVSAVLGVRAARRDEGLRPYLALGSEASASTDAADAISAGRRFWSLLPYLPIEGECLVRSALLIRFLGRLGLKADWVFGVRLSPFTAHCWVQVGDVCLNDDVERLVAYAPILVR